MFTMTLFSTKVNIWEDSLKIDALLKIHNGSISLSRFAQSKSRHDCKCVVLGIFWNQIAFLKFLWWRWTGTTNSTKRFWKSAVLSILIGISSNSIKHAVKVYCIYVCQSLKIARQFLQPNWISILPPYKPKNLVPTLTPQQTHCKEHSVNLERITVKLLYS